MRLLPLGRWPLMLGLLGVAAAATAAAPAPVVMQVHEQREMRLPGNLERIAIADPTIADIVPIKGHRDVLLVGKGAGRTTLMLWLRGHDAPRRYQVEVRSAVQDQLMHDQSAELTVQDGRGAISGQSPSMLDHETVRQAGLSVTDDKQALGDASTISSGGVVQVDVKVVELNKTVLRQIGLNFRNTNGGFSYGVYNPSTLTSVSATDAAGSVDGSGINVGATSPIASAFNLVTRSLTHNWFGDLSVLQSNGMARLLAEPSLVALSGQSASFLAGGELPIPQPEGLGTTSIVFKPFGIGLTVTPTVLSKQRIALKVAPEASDLNYDNALMFNGVQVPSINTRRADTTVELGDGESFVIGGLVSRTTSSVVNKVPLLGDIPIIGAFFRDLNYKQQDKELVFVVTPHLVHPFARGAQLPLPGDREQHRTMPVWGAWLIDPAGSDQMPGFSR